jgi:carbamoylphosphate synthase large subunit
MHINADAYTHCYMHACTCALQVSQGGNIVNYAISEHVENAGVHSGDATLLLPAQKLWVETIRRVKRVASAICKALNISGPFNIQLMARENEIKVRSITSVSSSRISSSPDSSNNVIAQLLLR